MLVLIVMKYGFNQIYNSESYFNITVVYTNSDYVSKKTRHIQKRQQSANPHHSTDEIGINIIC